MLLCRKPPAAQRCPSPSSSVLPPTCAAAQALYRCHGILVGFIWLVRVVAALAQACIPQAAACSGEGQGRR